MIDPPTLLRNIAVIDGPLSEQMRVEPDEDLELGDNVVVLSFSGGDERDVVIHLRRGMEPDAVADALEVASDMIRDTVV